jgi:hypothetical protein
VIGAVRARDRKALANRVDTDDRGRAHELRACDRTEADRTQGEYYNGVANPHAFAFRTGKPVDMMSRWESD